MEKYRCPNCGEVCLPWRENSYFVRRTELYKYWSINRYNESHHNFIAQQKNILGSGKAILFLSIHFFLLIFFPFANMFFIFLLHLYILVIALRINVVRSSLFGATIQYSEEMHGCIMQFRNVFYHLLE